MELWFLKGLPQGARKNSLTLEKETVVLDIILQLTIVEALDDSMYNHVVNRKTAKHVWETIEIIC